LTNKDIETKKEYKYKYFELLDIFREQEKRIEKIHKLINSVNIIK